MASHQHDENCKKMFALLYEYLDMELPAGACRDMEAHMAGCTPCKDFTESLKKTIELCRRYRAQEMPGPIANDAREKLLEAYQKMLAERRV
jgi:RNA polymerase sigma-70 factor (ECF subfamily)